MEEENKNNEEKVKVAVENKEDKEKITAKNEENKEKETVTKKKSKKAKIAIIVICIILILVALGVGGFFAYQYVQENQTVGTAWGDTYYAYLKQASETEEDWEKQLYGIKPEMQNTKLQFCETKENQAPFMVMSYEKDGEQYLNTYYINEEGNVNFVLHEMPSTLELLYNIQLQQYIWYIHTESENTDTYKPLDNDKKLAQNNDQENNINETNTANVANVTNITNENTTENVDETTEYIISKDEETTQETVDGENITLTKFDETFVKPEIEESAKIDFNIDLIVKEIKQTIEEAIKGFKIESEIVTDDVEKQVEEKVNDVENTKQQMETAKQEIEQKKAEEEAKKKAEEEARKAAEEAAKKQQEENTTTSTTSSGRITKEQAEKLAQQIDGTYSEETGYEIGYTLERMVKDASGQEYYLFRVMWMVVDHWSTIDGVAISVDGKKWKQTDIYSKGETMGEVYREGTF